MSNNVSRVTTMIFLTLSFAPTMAHAQFGGGGMGGAIPGAGFAGGQWRAGGGIAGGGWHGGGAPNAGFRPGMGAAPGFGFGGMPGNPAGGGNMPGQMIPGAGNTWTNAHPYAWYNGHWNNHRYGNGFAGYANSPRFPSLSAVLTSSSAPANTWDRFGTGSGMGGYASANYPPAWGIGGWGQGNQWYNSGYVSYYNPYNDPAVTTAFNYGRPIPVPTGATLRDTDNPAVGLAIDRFRTGDYAKALALIDGVINIQPYDAAAHELRGLILFAMKDYPRAAATIHSVLATGPGWDWTTLSSVYSNMQHYQSQLEALENYVDSHPNKLDARFLLAYHYITAGHTDDAKKQLEQVTAREPNDQLAARLLRMVDDGAATQAAPNATAPNAAAPNAAAPDAAAPNPAAPNPAAPNAAAPNPDLKPIDPKALIGNWRAKRDDGSVFALDFAANKTYTWNFTRQGQFQTMTGNYTLDEAMLTLRGSRNQSMVAQVLADGVDRFRFKPLAGAPDDPGLTFVKQK